MRRIDEGLRAHRLLERVPREGLYANVNARDLFKALLAHEFKEHARLAVERARKARKARKPRG